MTLSGNVGAGELLAAERGPRLRRESDWAGGRFSRIRAVAAGGRVCPKLGDAELVTLAVMHAPLGVHQRRASNTGVILVAGQKIALGRIHAGQVVTVHLAEHTITIDLGGDDTRTIRRTTTQPVRSIKAHRPRKARTTHVS